MRMLIASGGLQQARNAAHYAALFARPASAAVTLLGVVEERQADGPLVDILESLRLEIIRDSQCQVAVKIRRGLPDEQILAEAGVEHYDLVVVGSFGRRTLRGLSLGTTATRLARSIQLPLLVVNREWNSVERVLICTSGEKPGENDALVGGTLAALVGAEVTVLHVMSQIALVPEARLEDLERNADELINTKTREGSHLQRSLEILAERGVRPERRHAKVRHGLVLDEILAEAREGGYDLLVIGAHQVPEDQSQPGLRQLLLADTAADIITHAPCPVLVVRTPLHDTF